MSLCSHSMKVLPPDQGRVQWLLRTMHARLGLREVFFVTFYKNVQSDFQGNLIFKESHIRP
jgi:hypothetical protein